MKTETKFQDAFKELLKEVPLDNVSVHALCVKVNSNRQTFYYHFRDISDVIDSILLNIRNLYKKESDNIITLTKNILRFSSSHSDFLKKIIDSELSEKVYDLFYSFYYKNIIKLIPAKLNKDMVNQVSRMSSHLFTKETLIYISSSRKENQNKVANRFNAIFNYFINAFPKEKIND